MPHFSTSWQQLLRQQAITVCFVLFSVQFFPAGAYAGDADVVTERYVAMAIQGDLSGAAKLLDEAPSRDDPATMELRKQFEARFVAMDGGNELQSGDPFLDDIAGAYRTYWRQGLLGKTPSGETVLAQMLSGLLALHGETLAEADAFNSLRSALNNRGVRFFESPAAPLRDLFIWDSERTRRYSVRLTDVEVPLNVHFMDDFLLQGWKDFASLGRVTTTGWVDHGELYCLADAYDTSSERFEISFLKHEARHLVDLEKYPEMTSEELEYRAKLTELAFADRSLANVLEDFSSKAAQNPDSPHAMANWRVSRDVYYQLNGSEMTENFAGWEQVQTGKVNRAARKLLKLNQESNK